MDKDPVSLNVEGVQSLVGSKLNKTVGGVTSQLEGEKGDRIDELTLDLKDEDLIALADKMVLKYEPYEAKLKLRQEAQKTYYLGR